MTRTLAELHCALAKQRMTAMLRRDVEAKRKPDKTQRVNPVEAFRARMGWLSPDEETLISYDDHGGSQ